MNAQRQSASITSAQLAALQTLYSRWASRSAEHDGDKRVARLLWASDIIGRAIDSFKDLTSDEGRRLIDALKGSLGQVINDRPWGGRRIRNRDQAQAAGTSGRHGVECSTIYLVGVDDLERINNAVVRLGWTREQFDAWLRSPSSPLGTRPDPKIRTLTDANKIWWAMKALLKRAGQWRPDDARRFRARRAADGTFTQEGPAA